MTRLSQGTEGLMGSERKSEREKGRRGERGGAMAGCAVYKRVKEASEGEEGKCQGHASQISGAGRSEAEEKVRQRGVQQTSE